MSAPVAKPWATTGGPLCLPECLLRVARRGDSAYLEAPASGQLAVIDLADGSKAFFSLPADLAPGALHALIEDAYSAPAERIGEFVWVVFPAAPSASIRPR